MTEKEWELFLTIAEKPEPEVKQQMLGYINSVYNPTHIYDDLVTKLVKIWEYFTDSHDLAFPAVQFHKWVIIFC